MVRPQTDPERAVTLRCFFSNELWEQEQEDKESDNDNHNDNDNNEIVVDFVSNNENEN